jgi:hypothetical protein
LAVGEELKYLASNPFICLFLRHFQSLPFLIQNLNLLRKMSLTFDWTINPILLLLAAIGGGIIGFVVRRVRLAKAKSKIQKLESDLLVSNQETLEAQQAYVALEAQLKDQTIPVIPMKINTNKENPEKKMKS